VSTASIERPKTDEQEAVERILNHKLFVNAPLLSSFLIYVCQRALEEGAARISEQEIGVHVFHRPRSYDPSEDNIVRNYARQLRKRLEEYYAADGQYDSFRVEIPKGGYVPRITPVSSNNESIEAPKPLVTPEEPHHVHPIVEAAPRVRRPMMAIAALIACVSILCFLTFYLMKHYDTMLAKRSKMNALWSQLFNSGQETLIVPADAAFVTLEEIKGRTFSLAEYESGLATGESEPSYITALKGRRMTSVVDLDIAAKLEHLPGINWDRTTIRPSRSLRIEDLKSGNAILIGSIYSTPWIEAFQNNLNFHFFYRPGEHRAWIENAKPLPGESAVYESNWDGFSKRTYAVIAFIPNLSNTGHILLIQGLDGAGTEAASDMLFRTDGLNDVIDKARRADKTLKDFEVLIEASAVDNHATAVRIAAMRMSK
jgi:hypothetical protein